MKKRPWRYVGDRYTLRQDPETMGFSLTGHDLMEISCCIPFATVHPAPHPSRTSPAGLRGASAKVIQGWNPRGTFVGITDPSNVLLHDEGFSTGDAGDGLPQAISWRAECLRDRIFFTIGFRNPLDRELRLYDLVPLAGTLRFLKGPLSDWNLYKMSSNTTLPSGILSLTDSERNFGFRFLPAAFLPSLVKKMLVLPRESVGVRRGVFSSQWFTLLVHKGNGPSILIGFADVARHFSTLSMDTRHGCFQAAAHGEGCVLTNDQRFTAHRLLVLFGENPFSCIESYLSCLTEKNPPRFRPASLWGTWYSGFHDRFQWNDLLENLEGACSAPERLEYFQLDDGYQKALGDWTETKSNLPEGLPGFAEKVLSRGMNPGIWVAPFAVGRDASIFRDHPDWLVRKASGRPVLAGVMPGRFRLRPYYGLDLSHPEVLGWLGEVFRKLVDWGFQLFKLDYLAAGTLPGIRAEKGVTSAEAYRKGLMAIREAVGDFPLLGALAPQLSGVGIMDIQRVSTDSSFGGNHWSPFFQRVLGDFVTPGLRNNLRNNLTRSFFADRIWTNDCDAILAGGLSPAEQKTHIAANLLLGGVFQVGFDLREEGYPWSEISRLTRLHPKRRLVPDLFEREMPREAFVVAQNEEGKDLLLYLLLNLNEQTCRISLRDPCHYLDLKGISWEKGRDFWSGEVLGHKPGDGIDLPPHDSFLMELPLES